MKDIQELINQVRTERGFTMEPHKIFILLNEEIGEIAKELKKNWSRNYESSSKERLEEELADAFVCLCALANQYNIDLETAVKKKFVEADSKREWKTKI